MTRILHVVATDLRRGAEVLAADVIGALDDAEQQVAVLHGSGGAMSFGAPTTVLGTRGRPLPGLRTELGIVRGLRRLVGWWRPDVVHAWGGEPLRYAVLAGGRPVVYTRIGWASPGATRGPRRLLHRWLIRRAARIVTVAEAVRRETTEVFGIPPGDVVTIPAGRDPARIEPSASAPDIRRDLGIPPEAPVVLSLGALAPEKDPLGHLEVMRRVREAVPEAVHLMVGDGPLRAEVEAAARGLGDAFRLPGRVADTGGILAASDVMLLASRSEGMPVVLIEAGMAGLPAAAYAVAGAPEVVVDGETGLLAPPGEAEALAGAVAKLLWDRDARRAMGEAARERCLERFHVAVIAARYRRVYEDVTAR